jgi:hypothetical protein
LPTAASLPLIQLAPPSFRTKPQMFALLGRVCVVFPHKAADDCRPYVFPRKAADDFAPYVFPHKAADDCAGWVFPHKVADNARFRPTRPHLWLCAERRAVSLSAAAAGRVVLSP